MLIAMAIDAVQCTFYSCADACVPSSLL
eukprot:COSAG02_NODE_33312_length_502_cov_0.774194_1_plen_27_part_10